ncbi:hypothetical protein [Alkalilimnicola sp. S0819]|uniref:hypothetical protein n=1 Tax=Alkalilimnicola sp. S0819 TaxID=2613922 RepID=UPI0012628F18|nr:hypothetical protein [Alkalilimnicola sp. S0819]KAB7628320.1 hypothetical protein F3N43_01020 [Alkalilimnicola sp. S0819]MPQ15218.1 hypothetical protein [Alkalilimnicola sp. S0819]
MPTEHEQHRDTPRQPGGAPAGAHSGGDGPSDEDPRAEQLRAQAENLGHKAREHGLGMVDEQKAVAADQLNNLSRALRDTAERLQGEQGGTARYLRQAAEGLGRLGDGLRERDARQLYDQAAGFVRRQPAVVFAGALAAGFLITRFLKAEPEDYPPTGTTADAAGHSDYGGAPSSASAVREVSMPGMPQQGREH